MLVLVFRPNACCAILDLVERSLDCSKEILSLRSEDDLANTAIEEQCAGPALQRLDLMTDC